MSFKKIKIIFYFFTYHSDEKKSNKTKYNNEINRIISSFVYIVGLFLFKCLSTKFSFFVLFFLLCNRQIDTISALCSITTPHENITFKNVNKMFSYIFQNRPDFVEQNKM